MRNSQRVGAGEIAGSPIQCWKVPSLDGDLGAVCDELGCKLCRGGIVQNISETISLVNLVLLAV
jgi:hypothetical protein